MAKDKIWNWQQKDWPHFRYDSTALSELESKFLQQSGVLLGAAKHLGLEETNALLVDQLSTEALKTSEIEGEILSRDSLQSSIRRNFGLAIDNRRVPAAEQGIAEMMTDLYQNFSKLLTSKTLYQWHAMLMKGRKDLHDIGRYRRDEEPMQVISGPMYAPKIHFEAPPSKDMAKEMKRFISWFNSTAPGNAEALPPLTRAGIAHLYFISIHPFADGNGRIGRALSVRAISQGLGQSTLIALSQVIHNKRKAYYDMLEKNNKTNEITGWLIYFAQTLLDAQSHTLAGIEFLIGKTKFFDRFRGQLNDRQEKAIIRMFKEGPQGFEGGLSTEKYIRITGTSRATATRDLQDLTGKGALSQTGRLKGTRYYLI